MKTIIVSQQPAKKPMPKFQTPDGLFVIHAHGKSEARALLKVHLKLEGIDRRIQLVRV